MVEGGGEQLFVLAAELADGVVVGMGVSAEVAGGDVFVGGGLDLAAGERVDGL